MNKWNRLITILMLTVFFLPQVQTLYAETEQCTISYSAYLAEKEWQYGGCDGSVAGTTGESRSMEALNLSLNSSYGQSNCRIVARGHMQDKGWTEWTSSHGWVQLGTPGKSKRLEAVQIYLENCPDVTLRYQAHVQYIGWMDWVQNGEVAGTTGQSLRMEAIRIEAENPESEIEYRHPFSYYDAETASLHLPLMAISDSRDGTGNRYIRSRLTLDTRPGHELLNFILDPPGPNILPEITEIPVSKMLIREEGNTTITVPALVIESGDDILVYDAEFTSREPYGNNYIISRLTHRPVPVDDGPFVNCKSFFDGYQGIFDHNSAYRVYGLATGIDPKDIPNYGTIQCCIGMTWMNTHMPGPLGQTDGSHCAD